MNKPLISIIAAIDKKTRALGYKNKLLWHIPEDMRRFKELTSNHAVVMGRKTWESLPKKFRPLPNRTNIVITRNINYLANGAEVVHSLSEALQTASQTEEDEIFIMGGGEIYKQALIQADKLYLTLVDDENVRADTFFPEYNNFKEVGRRDIKNDLSYSFIKLERK